MPELAEVEFARKVWNPGLGAVIQKVEARAGSRVYRDLNPTTVKRNLCGVTLESSETHGKKMLFRFSQNRWLGLHLGMTGGLFVDAPDYIAGKHDALLLRQGERSLVFRDPRQFGRVLFHRGSTNPDWWNDLPPEVNSDAFTLELVSSILKRRARAPIKAVLLMQQFFPGIGNWMVDEILWRARIHPARLSGKLSTAMRFGGKHVSWWRELWQRWANGGAIPLKAGCFTCAGRTVESVPLQENPCSARKSQGVLLAGARFSSVCPVPRINSKEVLPRGSCL